MKRKSLIYALAAAGPLLFFNVSYCAAAGTGVAAMPVLTASAAKPPLTTERPARKAARKGKLVDINSAGKDALMRLPGITSEQAGKIIANRPYGSKTWLVSNGVLAAIAYEPIKPLIEARQPFKTAAENASFYEKRKKDKPSQP